MSTPTPPSAPSAAVLTHPAFDRPPVENERRPGRRKGAVSLRAARTARADRIRREAREVADRIKNEAHALAFPDNAEPNGPSADKSIALTPGDRKRGAKETTAPTPPAARPAYEDAVIGAALAILSARMREPGAVLCSPQCVREFLALQLGARDREAFGVIFVDSQHRVIAFEVLFEGTLTQASVYPREVVRRALHHNACAVILAHNHPSGSPEPSLADELLTQALKLALSTVDVRVLDHFVIGGERWVSFAERGLL